MSKVIEEIKDRMTVLDAKLVVLYDQIKQFPNLSADGLMTMDQLAEKLQVCRKNVESHLDDLYARGLKPVSLGSGKKYKQLRFLQSNFNEVVEYCVKKQIPLWEGNSE